MLAVPGKSSCFGRQFGLFAGLASTRFRDDRGGLGDNCDFAQG